MSVTTGFVAIALALSGEEFVVAAKLVFVAHIPIMVVEALITGAAVYLARRVKPEIFDVVAGGR